MKTKADGVPKAFEPYTKEEIQLLLSMLPTHDNVRIIAKTLGRSRGAIYTLYRLAYSVDWLKENIQNTAPHQDNVVTKIASAKKKLGIFVGHRPK